MSRDEPAAEWMTRGWHKYGSRAAALEAMAERGLRVDAGQFSEWASGKVVPHADNAKVQAIREFFGEEGQTVRAEGDLAEAIREQTEVLSRGFEMLDRRLEALELLTERQSAQEHIADLEQQAGVPTPPLRPDPTRRGVQ